jgi:DHA1 family bicyclomycin/chloramphenicol resistance-like MFS transporter
MTAPQTLTAADTARKPLTFFEFVSLIACMMALTALSIDIMLPALPRIGTALGTAAENDRQFIIVAYVAGFAIGQLFFGPLSDRFGRKPPLLVGLALYCAASAAAFASGSLGMMLAARALQGIGAAAPRVIALAIVRDRFGGRDMARVMSFVMMVFIIVPILAPAVGQEILVLSEWRAIFGILLISATALALWIALRLEETRPAEVRQPFAWADFRHALGTIAGSRQTAGYILTTGFVFGIMMSYITSAEQIFLDVYKLGSWFPLAFAGIAIFLVGAAIVNASVVRRLGMRQVSQTAMVAAVVLCAIVALFGFPKEPPLFAFCGYMAAVFFCFGLMMPNFNALALEPVGAIAGTASSVAGFYSTAAGAAFAAIVGRSFDGSVRPLMVGVTILIAATVAAVLVTERFRLALGFTPRPPVNNTENTLNRAAKP